MRRRLAMFVLGITLLVPLRPAGAAPASGSLDHLATDLAGKLGPALEGRRVPQIALLLQVRQPPGIFVTGQQQLATVLAQLVATRIRALKFRSLKVAPTHLAEADVLQQGLGGRHALTLLVHVVLTSTRLHLRGRLYDTNRTLWGRLKNRQARLLTHLDVSRALDVTIRSYLGRKAPSSVTCAGRWRPLGKQAYWGVALGDVDGDARQELVLLRRDAVEIRRWNKVFGRFDSVATVPFKSPLAVVRPRFVMGSLAVGDLDGDRRADILVRISDRQTAAVITYRNGSFGVRRRFGGYPLGVARLGRMTRYLVGYPMTGRAELSGRGTGWKPTHRAGMLLPVVYHNLRVAPHKRAPGASAYVYGVVDDKRSLTLRHLPGGKLIRRVAKVGRAFALGDLDGDGRPEVITTATRSFGSSDALVVHRLTKRAPVCRVAGFEGSVTAAAVGDVYLDGRAHVASVVWNFRKRRSYLLVVR